MAISFFKTLPKLLIREADLRGQWMVHTLHAPANIKRQNLLLF